MSAVVLNPSPRVHSKKVCLLYVGVGVAGFNPNRPPWDREGAWIGHGIASVAASARAAGHDVTLLDLRQLMGWAEAVEKIQQSDADVFGLSVSPVDSEFAIPLAEAIKSCHPKARVIVGGIHASIFPERYQSSHIDTVVVGEGEKAFCWLLEQSGPWPKKLIGAKPCLDELPWVARELFQYHRELQVGFAPDQKTPSITMLAGRGCPFHCTYCQPAENAVFGKPFRIRSAENVIAELQILKGKYQFRSITFWDDTFIINRKWVMHFADLYEQAKIGASIAACSRADIICRNEAMVERLAQIGVDWFVIGLESGSDRILKLIKKGTTVQQNKDAAKICRKYGIKVFGTYMYGLPTETNEEAMMTARMIDEIQPEHRSPFYFVPIEGTEIHSFCAENGFLLPGARSSIARTGVFQPAIKGVDYEYLNKIREGYRA